MYLDKIKTMDNYNIKEYFIYVYQHSLIKINSLNNNKCLNNYYDDLLKKYKNLNGENLWNALYFETQLLSINKYELPLLEDSINKTLIQVDKLSPEFLANQKLFNSVVLNDKGIQLLLERLMIFIEDSSDNLIVNMKKIGAQLKEDIIKYESVFIKNKIIPNIGEKSVCKYMTLIDAVIEIWYDYSYITIKEKVVPKLKDFLTNTTDELFQKQLIEYISKNKRLELKPDDIEPIDICLSYLDLKSPLMEFTKSIVKLNKNASIMFPIFEKHFNSLINTHFSTKKTI